MLTLNIHGRLVHYDHPVVMGIINATPDSFHAGSRCATPAEAAAAASRMVGEGAGMLDVGACSTRPGAEPVDAATEWERLRPVLEAVREAVGPDFPVSVDTFRAGIARKACEGGLADIINDVGGGMLDPDMHQLVAELRVPYILTHMRGTPATMQQLCDYPDGVTAGVIAELQAALTSLTQAGVADVIVDPGFGFAKTIEQNYRLLHDLPVVAQALQRPLLAGLSRKSMATRLCGISADEALPATSVLNALALQGGSAILRVHDVAAARHVVAMIHMFNS
ncbi:MAG: dihydropteroate synthase [Muribaculaceae bacterium]|nr:dihydropteroate synthase [Muribaculaceae bacterium]